METQQAAIPSTAAKGLTCCNAIACYVTAARLPAAGLHVLVMTKACHVPVQTDAAELYDDSS